MPMVTLYNRLDSWRYNSTLREKMLKERNDPTYDGGELTIEDYVIWPMEEDYRDTHYSKMTLTFDARMSITYNIGNWFINAFGQFSNYRYNYKNSSGRLNDWFINASVGLRL